MFRLHSLAQGSKQWRDSGSEYGRKEERVGVLVTVRDKCATSTEDARHDRGLPFFGENGF